MPSPPPRLAPTVALAILWVALYLLYLTVKPEPPAPPERDRKATTTTSSVIGKNGDDVSRAVVRERAPVPTR